MLPNLLCFVNALRHLDLDGLLWHFWMMSDFDFGPVPGPQNEETFQPGVTITPDGVSLFAADFRAQAIRDGALVDVSEMASQAGFVFPVAVTRNLWEDIQAIPEAYSHESVDGRLWDVLYMAHMAIRHSTEGGSGLRYNLILHVGDTNIYPVRLVCGPGDGEEPVITLSNPQRDVDLPLGHIVITEGALDAFVSAQASPAPFLARHQRGDWGEVGEEDTIANDLAVLDGTRILSAYWLAPNNVKIWIITEWDRSATTILLPSEY